MNSMVFDGFFYFLFLGGVVGGGCMTIYRGP